ncbi:MAG: glycosyltransferase family 4 protein [Flavobacteriales bacterium]|nr:glycosyltransferase family 4 protein [Flavobacteriales bacterium]
MASVLNIVFNDFTRDSRVRKISRSLAAHGYAVRILCMYEEGLPRMEQKEGYTVTRFEIKSRKWKHIVLLRPLMYLEFIWKSLRYLRETDVLHINDVEPLPIGVIFRILSLGRVKLVYDAHELESAKKGVGPKGQKMVRIIERSARPFVSGFITISESVAKYYRETHGFDPVILFNCPPSVPYEGPNDGLRTEFGLTEEDIIFIYQGGLAPGRGIEQLLEAFSSLKKPHRHLVILGFGRLEELVKQADEAHSNIHFKASVPMEQLLRVTAGADVGFSMLSRDCENHETTLPNKLFEYMAARIPVIVSPVREMSRYVRDFGIGHVLQTNSPEAIVEVVEHIEKSELDRFKAALESYAGQFTWEVMEKKLIALYDQVCETPDR